MCCGGRWADGGSASALARVLFPLVGLRRLLLLAEPGRRLEHLFGALVGLGLAWYLLVVAQGVSNRSGRPAYPSALGQLEQVLTLPPSSETQAPLDN